MDPQRSWTLDAEDLIKKIEKRKNKEVKWRKTQTGAIVELTVGAFGQFFLSFFVFFWKGSQETGKNLNMTSIKLAGFTIIITLIFQSKLIFGETLLTPETNKDSGVKTPEKRNNFRVPMEMPYDPNFWPARGRRSRRDPEKVTLTDNCFTPDGNYIFEKCPELSKIRPEDPVGKKLSTFNFEFLPPIVDDDLVNGGDKTDGDCNSSRDVLETNFLMNPKRVDKMLHKKQRYYGLPLILYGNGFYWAPENLYGGKKKKQDVFWVARGKKNFNFLQK